MLRHGAGLAAFSVKRAEERAEEVASESARCADTGALASGVVMEEAGAPASWRAEATAAAATALGSACTMLRRAAACARDWLGREYHSLNCARLINAGSEPSGARERCANASLLVDSASWSTRSRGMGPSGPGDLIAPTRRSAESRRRSSFRLNSPSPSASRRENATAMRSPAEPAVTAVRAAAKSTKSTLSPFPPGARNAAKNSSSTRCTGATKSRSTTARTSGSAEAASLPGSGRAVKALPEPRTIVGCA